VASGEVEHKMIMNRLKITRNVVVAFETVRNIYGHNPGKDGGKILFLKLGGNLFLRIVTYVTIQLRRCK